MITREQKDNKIKEFLWKIIKDKEGIYSNDRSDRGGETVYGISRKYFKDEESLQEMWNILDSLPENNKELIKNNKKAIQAIKDFYYMMYNKYFSYIPDDNKLQLNLKLKLFDIGTLIGYTSVSKILQQSINILGMQYNIKVLTDGIIGPKTVQALLDSRIGNLYDIQKVLGVIASNNAIKKMTSSKNNYGAKYIRGWIRRYCTIYTEYYL